MAKKRPKDASSAGRYAGLRSVCGLLACTKLMAGCSSDAFDYSEALIIAMFGSFSTSAVATGNAEPEFLEFTLEGAQLIGDDQSIVDIYAEEPATFRIIDRSQIIHEAAMSEHAGASFAAIKVSFSPHVDGRGRYEKELSTTLSQPTVTYGQPYTVKTGVKRRLEIHVEWKNIVTRDDSVTPPAETLAAPTMTAVLKDE